jgi:hypothetical protein
MFVDAAMAMAGAGEGVSSMLNKDEFGSSMEPLIVALRIKRGDSPIVAKEVMEVAMDSAAVSARMLSGSWRSRATRRSSRRVAASLKLR